MQKFPLGEKSVQIPLLRRPGARAVGSSSAAPALQLIRGRAAILAKLDLLEALSQRTGQAGAIRWLDYHMSSPTAVKKIPTLLLIGVEPRIQAAHVTDDDLLGAVMLYEYKLAGAGMRLFATDDDAGQRNVIALPHLRAQVAEAACRGLIERGAQAALVSLHSCTSGRTSQANSDHPRSLIATRARAVPLTLPLGDTHEQTLAALGKHTRRNLRYYRRRLETEMGAEFVPHAQIDRQQFLQLNRESTHPVPSSLAAWRYDTIQRLPGSMFAGVRAKNGTWLSVIGGRRHMQLTEIDWQINRAGLSRYALSTVMRAYTLEHEVDLGTQNLRFTGGTPHSMRHSFVSVDAMDIIAVRGQTTGRLLRRFAPWIFPKNNFLGQALCDRQLTWTRR